MALLRGAIRATSAPQYSGPLDLKSPQCLKGFLRSGAARLERSFGTPPPLPRSFGPKDFKGSFGPDGPKGVKGLCSDAAPARLDLSGVFPPIPTPFDEDESLALDRLAGNMQVWERLPFRGCVGGVNGLANILGAEVCQLYQLASEGRYAEALELHQRLLIPNALVTRELGVPAMKAAMDATGQGLYGGPCRRPLLPLSPEQRRRLLDAFRQHGFPLAHGEAEGE